MEAAPQAIRLSEFNSQKFRFWSFVAMFLLVYVHGYNLNISYLQPWTIPGEPLTFTTFFEYFVSNGILRFRIPMLFIISGYLYAMHDYRPYGQRTRKRLRTLLAPYLIWSAFGLLFTWVLEIIPYTNQFVANSHIVQIDDQRMLLHDYEWYEILFRWIILPVPYQLWFIRVLLIYNIAYPAIRWCTNHRIWKWVFFGIALLMWLATAGFVFFEGEGLLFFSLGIWINKNSFNIDKPAKWLNPIWWGIIFIVFSIMKTWLAFEGEPLIGNAVYPVLAIMHKIVILSGLIAAWYGCDALVRWCMSKKWFVWLAAFSFMIYVFHAPLVAYATNAAFAEIAHYQLYRLTTFIFLPLVIITLAVIIGAIIRKTMPSVYSILTGGRGF